MAIRESGEDYLETILVLEKAIGNVRSIDIATDLGYSKPSVSRAMGILKKSDYIVIDESGYIVLTKKGRAKAEQIYDRHRTITRYFQEVLGVSAENAKNDACRIEHDLSEETYQKLKSALCSHEK
ncbi:MAG: metal-dependent transcriptional regulator [Eubacteriales bacterium]|nr:metal-dependent transcriptional regulator [Eubacteriales bacterium]MDD4389370.1 metal-dependent transcriptional regulator [Eubacteriales bacterium]